MSKLVVEEDFRSIVLEALGKEGKSISALTKELEKRGYRLHRLIVTGYLRALTDMNQVKETEVPPSKLYVPLQNHDDDIYSLARATAIDTSDDPDLRTLQILYALLRRPVQESELARAGVEVIKGKREEKHVMESIHQSMPKRLRTRFSVSEDSYVPDEPLSTEEYIRCLEHMVLSLTRSRHLVLNTKQSHLL